MKIAFSAPEKASLTDCDVVFATPHGVAMAQTPELIAAGTRVIDRRRFPPAGHPHVRALVQDSPYLSGSAGRVPVRPVELNREAISKARVIGNPGCYPTTVLLGLAPLLEGGKKLIDAQTLIADCKSGVSGAGRKAEVGSLFSEASDNFKAYGVAGHRHHPEIVSQLEKIAGGKVGLTFVPHRCP